MPLYHVQDDDRPMYVVANSFSHAISKWKDVIMEENDGEASDPKGVCLICEDDDLIA